MCWRIIDDDGALTAKCIHGGPYKGYIEIPDI